MPFDFLKKLEPEIEPNRPSTYPRICQESIANALQLWIDEIYKLDALNLPWPTIKYAHQTTYKKRHIPKHKGCERPNCDCFDKPYPAYWEHSIELIFPKYEPPPYLLIPLVDRSVSPQRKVYCFIAGDEEIVERAQKFYDAHDLRGLLNNFPVRFFSDEHWVGKEHWTNDPYNFFTHPRRKHTSRKDSNSDTISTKNEWTKPQNFGNLPQPSNLEETTYLDDITFRVMDERLLVFRHFFFGACETPQLDEVCFDKHWPDKQNLPLGFDAGFLFNAVVPEKDFARDVVVLKLLPSRDIKSSIIEQFFERIRPYLQTPASFELVSTGASIYFQLCCERSSQQHIEQQLKLFFPDFGILELPNEPHPDTPLFTLRAVPKLAYAFLKTSNAFSLDPYNQLLGILSELDTNQRVIMQVLCAPFPDVTFNRLLTFAQDRKLNERELEKKQPSWAMQATLYSSDHAVLEKIKTNFLNQYETTEQTWTFSDVAQAPFCRNLDAYGVVSTAELAALAHFPDKTVQCDLLETASMKSKLPPDLYTQPGVAIGESTARGQTKTVTIPDSVRDRHAYVVGKSGTGKSTLLFNAIRQDIERGSGVAVIDPHGDLVEEVLQYIPKERIEDTIYFNAADKEHPIGLNILNAQDEDEIGLLADDLLITFKRLSESWGERMENILRHTVHILLRTEDATFLDIKTLLQNPDYRQQVAARSNNRMLRDFWQLEYPNYPKDAAQPILNRMSKFSLSPTLTGILGQPDSSLNFFDVIQNKKILLVNISKGQIGEDTAQLLGSLIVSQLQLAIMRRAAMLKETRDPYYLYVDEFQNFTTSAFEKILSEARKYKLCLTLAHQYISQLDERTKNAILANVGTIVMFQSYPADAQALRPELGQYEPTDVTNLNTAEHQALCKPSTQSKDTFLFQTLAPPPRPQSHAKAIIEYTRENYATTPVSYNEPVKVQYSPPPPDAPAAPKFPRPARALPKEFANTGDKILHYVTQAEWLATPQIHELVYSHVSEAARASNASRDLKALVEAKRIKFQNFGKNKIYYTGRHVNPTTHNLAIRDLFAKILASGYELAEVNFFPQLPGLTPDLAVSFLNDDGSQTRTFWEYDAGTEGIAELLKKVSRYDVLARDAFVVFVFNSQERLQQFAKAAGATRIVCTVIDEFATLDDGVFVFLQGGETASEASGLFR